MATRRKRNLNFLPAEPRSDAAFDISAYPVDIGVGELMRLTRERLGHELQTVANQLRIRLSYLEAIEEARFRDLPGTTYAIGFVRSYADYLGLDGPDIVRRFREEAARIHGRTKLVFPALTAEGKIPRAAVLLVSGLALAAAYAGWYVLSSRQDNAVPVIAEVPDRLIALTPMTDGDDRGSGPGETVPTVTVNSDASTPTPAEPGPQTPAVPAVPEGVGTGSANAALPPGGSDGETGTGLPPDLPVVAAPAETAAPPRQVALGDPQLSGDAPIGPATGDPQTSVAAPAVAAPDIPAAPSVPATESPAQLQQAAVAGSGVVLEARMESWIKVVDAKGKTITQVTLKAGERYVVPDEPGLILRTGNAGGLDVLVGGRKAPPLGEVGEVHKRISLDPVRLLSGTAGSD